MHVRALSLSVMCHFTQIVKKKIRMHCPEVHFHLRTHFLSCLLRVAGVMGFSTEQRSMLWLPSGRRAAGRHWSEDAQHLVLLAQLPSAGPLQVSGLHRAQVSLSHSQGLQSPEVPALCPHQPSVPSQRLPGVPWCASPGQQPLPKTALRKTLAGQVSLSIPRSFRIQGRALGCDQVNSSVLHSSLSFA